jgi:hypothetical protein
VTATVVGYGGSLVLNDTLASNIEEESYRDRYPEGLDLRPDSDLHRRLSARILQLAQESHSKVQSRFAKWEAIDEQLTCYVDLSEKQKADREIEGYSKKKPIAIVVPMQYAIRETLLTYLVAAFLEDPLFRYDYVGGEDILKAMKLEKAIDLQTRRYKVALNLYTQWKDNLTYGYGVVSTPWKVESRVETRVTPVYGRNMFGMKKRVGESQSEEEVVTFEGTYMENVHPRLFLPDANVSIHDVQKGESVGWVLRTNYVNLLSQEKDDQDIFNVRYLRFLGNATSSLSPSTTAGGKTNSSIENSTPQLFARPVDVIYMYINLVPSEWGLGKGRYPEKWLFGLAGDQVLIKAQPLGLNHGMYPVTVAASDFDGYSVTPISKLETVYGLQKTIDWLFTSHIANVRKAINDMIIFDPYVIRQDDLENPEPGMLVRTRQAAWSRGISDSIMQLKVSDVTQSHLAEAGGLADLMHNATGAVDSLRGIMRRGSERRSAQEARDTHVSALSRLACMAKIISLQSMQDAALIYAYQTQQLMTKGTYAKINSTMEQQLQEEYGITAQQIGARNGRMPVAPEDLQIAFDIISHDGTVPGGENVDAEIQAFQIAASNPLIGPKMDMVRLYLHIMREAGAKNIDQFRLSARVGGQEEIQQQAQAGNFAPLPGSQEGGGNASF